MPIPRNVREGGKDTTNLFSNPGGLFLRNTIMSIFLTSWGANASFPPSYLTSLVESILD
jgi:hypothetical protein